MLILVVVRPNTDCGFAARRVEEALAVATGVRMMLFVPAAVAAKPLPLIMLAT
jgi:hypothetical protein